MADVLHGSLERIVYVNEQTGWTVLRLRVRGRREPVTVVGNLLGTQPGEGLRLTGRWIVDTKYGEQFRAEAFTTLRPATAAGIEKYLGSGLVRGVGPKMAARLVRHFGLQTLAVIEEHPEQLVEVPGFGPVRAERVRSAWAEQKAIAEVMIFLQGHGLSPALAVRIYRRYRARSVETVRENPFRLAEEIHGIGFRTADRIAARLGTAAASPERLRAGIRYTLNRCADDGDMFAERGELVRRAVGILSIPRSVGRSTGPEGDGTGALGPGDPAPAAVTPEALSAEVDGLIGDGALVREVVPVAGPGGITRELLALPALDAAERGVVSALLRLQRTPAPPLEVDAERAIAWYQGWRGITLAQFQRQAILSALHEKVLVVTGGPGTGKTTLVRGIVEIHARKGRRVLLCAPTGRAAQRLAESTGREARTIHRLLEFDPGSMRFRRDGENPLEADLVIADECSMIDTVLANNLLKAVPAAAQLLLVGDADQLPSVGPGNVLADLIASASLPVVRLTEIFRQAEASRIVVNAHRIHRGEYPVLGGGLDDFFWIKKEHPEDILAMVKRLVAEDIPRRFGFDPVREVQVLTPMRRGALGAVNLNVQLQALLNPHGAAIRHGAHDFRIGDKVMQIENDYDLDVYNGDIGCIEELDKEEGTLRVRFGDRSVGYDARDLGGLVLAYATSIHKAQGSEYPAVVIPLHSQHYLLLQRRLLYTAVTRGKRLVVLVGSARAMGIALHDRNAKPRNTRLAERLAAVTRGAPHPL